MQQAIILSWVIAAATMVWGNFVALLQENLKRLLAYSSIAHAGYMMVGVTAGFCGESHGGGLYYGAEGVLFYLAAYALMTLGVFGIILGGSVEEPSGGERSTTCRVWAGPIRCPLLALSVCLLSLSGIPPLVGFWAKFEVFSSLAGRRPARPVAFAARAGRDRDAERGRGSVLLPADRRRHVSASLQGRSHARRGLARGPGRGGVCQPDVLLGLYSTPIARGARAAATAAIDHPQVGSSQVAVTVKVPPRPALRILTSSLENESERKNNFPKSEPVPIVVTLQ